ncbi:MAG: NfeD family protein [Prolixibacteraceae bacterium]|nr:NfeD family protein [Prolixibacteraceae bacterium]
MELITVILLILLGVILLLVEFLLIPGISIAGIGSVLSLIVGIVLSFKYWGNMVGIIVLVSVVIFIPVLLYFLFKGKAMKPMILSSDIDGQVRNIDEKIIHVGDEGETIGRLAPMGKSKINGLSVETRSTSGYLNPKTKVKVIKIEGNTVIVEPINE